MLLCVLASARDWSYLFGTFCLHTHCMLLVVMPHTHMPVLHACMTCTFCVLDSHWHFLYCLLHLLSIFPKPPPLRSAGIVFPTALVVRCHVRLDTALPCTMISPLLGALRHKLRVRNRGVIIDSVPLLAICLLR